MLTPPDTTALTRFQTGHMVGTLACSLFPNGKEVIFNSDDFDGMAKTTKKWMDEGIEHIYEATFLYEGILVLIDVLKVLPEGVEIYEVKSSSSVKEIYLHDVSIQLYVLKQLGYTVLSSNLVHIDSSYIRADELELEKLFKIVNISDDVNALQADIPNKLKEYEAYLADKENEPDIEIGGHCKKPYECNAKEYCWKTQRNIPDYSVFNIFNLGSKKQVELYEKGIVKIEDIPTDYPMTAIQKQKVQNWKDQTTFIDKEKIQDFIDTLSYPIYHLDFETFQQAVPEWKGISPYQQIPFQYSLHIEHSNGDIEHKEFLGEDGVDPRYELAKKLVEDIPTNVTVLTYNMSFEKGVNSNLAESFPEFSNHLLSINEDIKDLMFPFQKKYYVTPEMQGSYSIKYVLPSLVPEMALAYKNLNGIQNGGDAMNAFPKLSTMNPDEKEATRIALLAYCKLDTLAMVEVLKKLKEI
ncbi:MAG: phosphomethylpyrimidine kinase [Arcobacter sp.]|nr:MAG: phosphomethylpyrimidine kinase [Arcobacter sp.]